MLTELKAGTLVDCVIGQEFTVNGRGKPVHVPDRDNGIVQGLDEFGNWLVKWPNGETYSYQASLLKVIA